MSDLQNVDEGTASPETPTADTTTGTAAPIFQVQGTMSTFGGPDDTGVGPDEGLALFEMTDITDPAFSYLFLAAQPDGTTGLARRLNPDEFYIACRWDYTVTSRQFLRTTLANVQSVQTGNVLQARPVDWGPSPDTGRVADLSPGLATALQLNTDDQVTITIAGDTALATQSTFAGAANGQVAVTGPAVITTDAWGAAPATSSFAQNSAAGIVVHNTQSANRAALTGNEELAAAISLAKNIQQSQMVTDHNWSDTGQHFTISRGGLILEGRHGSYAAAMAGKVVQAAHATSADGSYNLHWFGIELEGDNRQADEVTGQQYQALVELCAWLISWCKAASLPIIGHKDVLAGHTDCPGLFEQRIPRLNGDVAARRGQLP